MLQHTKSRGFGCCVVMSGLFDTSGSFRVCSVDRTFVALKVKCRSGWSVEFRGYIEPFMSVIEML